MPFSDFLIYFHSSQIIPSLQYNLNNFVGTSFVPLMQRVLFDLDPMAVASPNIRHFSPNWYIVNRDQYECHHLK